MGGAEAVQRLAGPRVFGGGQVTGVLQLHERLALLTVLRQRLPQNEVGLGVLGAAAGAARNASIASRQRPLLQSQAEERTGLRSTSGLISTARRAASAARRNFSAAADGSPVPRSCIPSVYGAMLR